MAPQSVNDLVAHLCGLAILLPSEWFRYFRDPDHDPELAEPKPETTGQYIVYLSGIPIWWSQTRVLLRTAINGGSDRFVPRPGRAHVCAEARVMIGVYDLFAEHGRCPFVANMLENSRTTSTNVFIRRLAWNMSYHAGHHSYLVVPSSSHDGGWLQAFPQGLYRRAPALIGNFGRNIRSSDPFSFI